MPASETPVPERPAPPGDEAAASTPAPAPDPAPVTVDGVRRVHVSEDWLATGVGLSIVTVGLLGLIPEGLVP
jgi:hypothetical protein